MPNDAKLGLVVGLGLVIAVAVIYYRNGAAPKQDENPAATAVKPTSASRQQPPRGQARPTRARPAVQSEESDQARSEPRRHTVAEGETLVHLAERYYGDREKSDQILQANREVLKGPEDLRPGIVLVIPELPGTTGEDPDKPQP